MEQTVNMESILDSIKKLLGPSASYEYFDTDIIMHINTAFMELNQLGVGPTKGFSIKDNTAKWTDFLDETNHNFEAVKTLIYLKVKLVFDPPTSSSVMESMNNQISRLEWRLNVGAETPCFNGEEEAEDGN